ncbi:unnamed protein product [Rotaria sordida]|uniref:Uncharacterized protein n=1 Tax=Rotaria sordida TaxID=392033 RepID=A0A818UCW7_9BILA|nr:unnamed protein product [Rotaria sordida]CAF1339389.1 unnamed protein product [Rotaria sordida]CAF3699272.1 unnamed protein product [Rotaria sordida]
MLSCRRLILSYSYFPSNRISSLLITRYNSSSIDISNILQEHSFNFEKKSSTTIAYETFVQTPSEFVANSLLQIHDSLNLPWWATIALATITFRVIVGASITISQQRFIERLQIVRRTVKNELEPRVKILNIQAMKGKTATVLEEKKNLQRDALQLTKRGYSELNVHPGKLLILALFGSIPWLYFTFGIRMICTSPITHPTISQEGILWFQNLAEADPYGILPLGFLIHSLIGISFNAVEKPGLINPRLITAGRIQRGITRTVVIGFTLIAFKLPAGILLFWTLNSILQLSQTIIFELPRIRNMLGLQPSRFGSQPIRLRWTLWKNKWSFFFRTLKWYSKL